MKRMFKVEKLELDKLITLLIELYESGIDYVDLSSDNSDSHQDKLVIQTKDEYINPDYVNKFNEKLKPLDEKDKPNKAGNRKPKGSTTTGIETTRLTEDDLNKLM